MERRFMQTINEALAALPELKRARAVPARANDEAIELVACGEAFPDHALEIRAPDGAVLEERAVGEIVVRGPSVSPGYYRNQRASDESFRDGWLHTGDLGYLADGQLYVCGRKKDLIIIRGANFYPQDIEWRAAKVEGVRRDNVVAFAVERNAEEMLVVCAEGISSEAPRLRAEIAARIGEYAGVRVGHVVIVRVGTLPKTSSGKPRRRRTKELFERGELEEHPQDSGVRSGACVQSSQGGDG
jgi:fatty-acyl-CoA synthase